MNTNTGIMQDQLFRPLNFSALDDNLSSWEKSKTVIIPVPYDLTASYGTGTRHGPLAIIEASSHLELYDDEIKEETASIGIHTLNHVEPLCSSPEKMVERVEEVVSRVLSSNKLPVILGGEHSITVGAVQAMVNSISDIGVVQFDAHADLRDTYQGSKYSHACTGRRIHEICKLTQVGIRSLSKEEFEFLDESEIETYFCRDLFNNENWINDFIKNLPSHIYVTIDLDVLDPSIMPAVGTPEPGGLGWYNITKVLKVLAQEKKILGFDIVELCPQPTNPAPDFLAAKLCYKLLGYIFYKL